MRQNFLGEISELSEKISSAGLFVPECDKDGNFKRIQCWRMIGVCWCVGIQDGKEVTGSRTNVLSGKKPDCFRSTELVCNRC